MKGVRSVLHVVISLRAGGLERLVVDWTNERNRRHPGSTAICCLDEPGELAAEVAGDCVISLGAKRSRKPFDLSALLKLMRMTAQTTNPESRPPNLESRIPLTVHSHNLAALQYSVLALLGIRGIRHVHTEHGTNVHFSGLKNRLRNRWLAGATREIVAVSQHTAAAISRDWGVPPDRVRVIPNGVSAPPALTERERLALAREVGLGGTWPVLGSVGRLAAVKGYDRLIRAFARIPPPESRISNLESRLPNLESRLSTPESPGTTLLLVGDGPERSSLERLCVELGVASRVRFAGFRPDARRLLSLMDVFVLPSRSEGLPVSLLEAVAAGVPVAVTDVGDCRTVVDNGKCGTILPADESRWPEIIAGLLPVGGEMPVEVRERAKMARERVGTRYSIASTLAAYERLYLTVVDHS